MIIKKRYHSGLLLAFLSILYLIDSECICKAIDPRQHQIDIHTWGATTNGMQLGFGIDEKEFKNSTLQYVTAEFVVKNTTSFHRIIIDLGSHKGLFFFAKAPNGNKRELLATPPRMQGSIFIYTVGPGTELPIYLRIKREDLLNLAMSSALADVTINEGEKNVSVPISPFTLEVAIALPD